MVHINHAAPRENRMKAAGVWLKVIVFFYLKIIIRRTAGWILKIFSTRCRQNI